MATQKYRQQIITSHLMFSLLTKDFEKHFLDELELDNGCKTPLKLR